MRTIRTPITALLLALAAGAAPADTPVRVLTDDLRFERTDLVGLDETAALLRDAAGRPARAIPMDGFHLDNGLLETRGLVARKGAPETFDAQGFIHMMHRLKQGGEVVYPLFDRSRDLAVAGTASIEAECDVAIVEGNYLLFGEDPWQSLKPLWDLSVWLDTPEEVLRGRLLQRWFDHGHTPDEALARAERNDLPNARRILAGRLEADVTFAADDIRV